MQFQLETIIIKGSVFSKNLNRLVLFRVVAPQDYSKSTTTFSVVLMNDGQDYEAMQLEHSLSQAFASKELQPFIYVGVSCNENRIHEYGTASTTDFKGRGGQALKYSRFITEEFVPFLKQEFKASKDVNDWVYCGMSLGGLSAFDIVYNYSTHFAKVGVFSGSFWWRKKAYVKNDLKDRSRIALEVIKNGAYADHLKFWFQCGSLDEIADRNNNGIIDAIEDTLDVIKELTIIGYSYPGAITYVQVEGGKHDLTTWGKVFPQFITWAMAKTKP
ncbi:alpha/beta hydrolase [Maribacter sp. ACAM166]|uniref:alpha/beta hydrolase n=1 Tax=Maribacter sp. ACAM166 TaxID=2508996 RepID=UPI0010FDD850|nr:alpha/beta hydrolase-fold protein [Maribacter sp. ACAM166]TLP73006.1 esterase family protein [Maribacter sp. ACAM166]